jgi:hypothetical protein
MERRKWKYMYFFAAAVFLLVTLFQSCTKENIEDKFLSESVATREYYLTNVLPLLNSKCFSCHTYHNSSANRYDTYTKASAVAEEMASRTSSTHANTVMPPLPAQPLSKEEKQVFEQFYQLVKGGGESGHYALSISWTAYKFPDSLNRVGVSGSFDNIVINYKNKNASDIYEFLTDAEIMINTNSVNIGNDSVKSYNVRNHFFSYFTPVIYGKVINLNAASKKAEVKFTMNGISQQVMFDMVEMDGNLVFSGSINNIRYFNAQSALDALQEVCGEFHQNKVWQDISLKAEIKNYKKFTK